MLAAEVGWSIHFFFFALPEFLIVPCLALATVFAFFAPVCRKKGPALSSTWWTFAFLRRMYRLSPFFGSMSSAA